MIGCRRIILSGFYTIVVSDECWQCIPLSDGVWIKGELVDILGGCWLLSALNTSGLIAMA